MDSSANKKIVHVCNFLMPGLGYQEHYLAKMHSLAGHEVRIITSNYLYPNGEYAGLRKLIGDRVVAPGERRGEIQGVIVERLPVCWEVGLRLYLRGLAHSLRKFEPDVIIVHGVTQIIALQVWLAIRTSPSLARAQVIYDDHMLYSVLQDDISHRAFYWVVKNLWVPALRRSRASFVAVTKETARFMEEFYGLRADEAKVVPLGVDSSVFKPSAEKRFETRSNLGIPQEAVLFFHAGKIIPEKGTLLLVEKLAPLMRQQEDIYLLLVGDGPSEYESKIQAAVKAAGVENRFIRVAAVTHNELPSYHAAADVAVWPLQESMTALEAMASGVPVILRDTMVSRERLAHGGGLLFQTESELAMALEKMACNREFRQQLAAQARTAIVANFDWATTSRALLKLS